MNRTLVIAISILLAFCAGIYFWTEWQKKEFDASLPEPPAVEEQQVTDDTAGGHWHGDEWHAEPHNAVDAVAGPQEAAQDEVNLIPLDFTENVTEMQESSPYVLPPGTSREDAIRVNEAYKKWIREVWQPAHDEWWQLAQQTTKIFSFKDEDFMRQVDNMSDEERAELAAKVQAHDDKSVAAYKRLQAIERDMPDFTAEVLGGE